MKKITRKETNTVLLGVQLTGKEFVTMLQDKESGIWDTVEWVLPFKDKDGDPIIVNNLSKITIDGTVTILLDENAFEDRLPIVA
jgi:hypothetical protein